MKIYQPFTCCRKYHLTHADVEIYGLYTYEELNSIVPMQEIMFDAVNGQYLKVAIGKGIITIEQISELVERYGRLFEQVAA